MRFYEHMADLIGRWGNEAGLLGRCDLSCVGAVVAPKDAASTAALRARLPRTPFLVPGYGAQGATADSCRACFLPDGTGAVVNASRSVIYAFDQPEYMHQCGPDWQASIAAACRRFAVDLAQVQFPNRA
jgi:orotidine-5'-phosphate decarboxylase